MGSLVRQHVFVASSDDQAASVLQSGPAQSVTCDPGLVGLWALESLLTGRSFTAVVDDYSEPLALFNGGQRFVHRLSDRLRDHLAELRGVRAVWILRRWALSDVVRAERMRGRAVSDLFRGLQELARTAKAEGAGIYVWVDVDPRAF